LFGCFIPAPIEVKQSDICNDLGGRPGGLGVRLPEKIQDAL
jgi:hypothetical protein